MNWNLKLLYENLEDPIIEEDLKKSEEVVNAFVEKWKDNTEYLKEPQVLKTALDEYEKLLTNWGVLTKPYFYTLLSKEIDLNNTDLKARLNKLHQKGTKLENRLQFFLITLSKISKKTQSVFLKSKSLRDYKHFLEMLFANAKFVLSEKEERVFNLTSKTSFSNWINMVEELLSKQTATIIDEDSSEKKVSYNEINKYITSRNKAVRDIAAREFNNINKRYIEIAEYEINSVLERKQINDEYRGVERPDLPRHLSDDMDSEIVDSLITSVTKNFDISRKYYQKKAKLLGQKKLGYHERNVPIADIDGNYSFEKSFKIVKEVFKALDPEFFQILNTFEKSGQYDAFPKSNKSGGAYCIHVNKKLPTYILLNHNDRFNDVLTIAHESGHGIHSELVNVQNSLNNSYSTALAEVASTFFEDFVLKKIMKDIDDKKVKKAILMERLNDDVNTIFRQVAFYNFELELHTAFRKKGYLSSQEVSDIFVKHMRAYLGDAVEVDDGMKYGWIYVSHFRRFFYVYTYASGLLISKFLQRKVREDNKFIENFKEFLKTGSSKSPKDIFMDMDIDISKESFWEEGIRSIEKEINHFQ